MYLPKSVRRYLHAVFIALALCLGSRVSQAAPHGRALIVGVNKYLDTNINGLSYSVPDAKLIADVLTDPERGLFPRDEVRLLTDDGVDEEHRPNRLSILEGVQWLSEAEPDETILLYLAGHGVVDGKGRHFFAGRDTKLTALPFTAVAVDDINSVLDDLARTKARRIIVIFDSCHSGTTPGARDIDNDGAKVASAFLKDQGDGKVVLASCGPDEKSYEDDKFGHGIFTYYLVEGLRGAAGSTDDGIINVDQAYDYTDKKVEAWAKARGNLQTPRKQTNVNGSIFLCKDPAKWSAHLADKSQRKVELSQLREKVVGRLGPGANDLNGDEGSLVLAAIDRTLADAASGSDDKVITLARKYSDGQMNAQAWRAEMKLINGSGPVPLTSAPAPATFKIQLFQPEWQPGATDDEFKVVCQAGEDVKVVGLADSPLGMSRIVMDGKSLSARSLDSRDLVMAKRASAGTNLRFEGIVHVGDTPTASVLTATDAAGNHRLIVLHFEPRGAVVAGVSAPKKNTVAVIGLSKKEVDAYAELHTLRVGQGLQQIMTRAVRDVPRFRLVEEKAEVLRGLVDMQWRQNQAAFDPDTAVRAGRLLGARYVLYGEVYDFGTPHENKGKLYIKVQVRLVDVETAAITVGDGGASILVPKSDPGEAEFDRSSLAQVSDTAIRAALQDLFSRPGTPQGTGGGVTGVAYERAR